MTTEETLERVQQIFRDVFDRPGLEIRRKTTAKDVQDWDSLAHINLVVAIEKSFHITFALGELRSLQNVGNMVDLIVQKSTHE